MNIKNLGSLVLKFYLLIIVTTICNGQIKTIEILKKEHTLPCPLIKLIGPHAIGQKLSTGYGLSAECDTCRFDAVYKINSYKIIVITNKNDTIIFKNTGAFFNSCFENFYIENFKKLKQLLFTDFIIIANKQEIKKCALDFSVGISKDGYRIFNSQF